MQRARYAQLAAGSAVPLVILAISRASVRGQNEVIRAGPTKVGRARPRCQLLTNRRGDLGPAARPIQMKVAPSPAVDWLSRKPVARSFLRQRKSSARLWPVKISFRLSAEGLLRNSSSAPRELDQPLSSPWVAVERLFPDRCVEE